LTTICLIARGAAQGFDLEAVGFIATRLRRAHLVFGDVIYRRGDVADDMYIVFKGRVAARPPFDHSLTAV
jgi:hypothetical protein